MALMNNRIFTKYLTILFITLAIGGGLLVGGLITGIIPCANGKLIFVGPPSGGKFMVTFGTVLYPFRAVHPGAWVLGLASPGGACKCPAGNCELGAIPTQGTVRMMGTSP